MTNEYDNPLSDIKATPDDINEQREKLSRKVKTKWQDVELYESEVLDPSKPFSPPDWALSVHGTPFYAFDDYNYLQGQSGNGKSFTMCIYEAVILGAKFGDLKYIGTREKPKILHIDTEQSEGNVQLLMRRVYHLAGWEQGSDHSDQYQVVMLKETSRPDDRWAKVIKYCDKYRPDFLFVDGMLDVVTSMNDEEGCNIVVGEAGALASIYGLCFVGICHENPTNAKDKEKDGPAKPAGHVGSYSQRKASAGQSTVKILIDDTTPVFSVNPKKVRNKDYKGFRFTIEDTDIVVDGNEYTIGIPKWMDDGGEVEEATTDNRKEDVRSAVKSIQWSVNGLSYTELEKELKSYGITSKRKLGDYITLSKQYGFVVQNPDTKRYYTTIATDTETDTQIGIDMNKVDDGDDKEPF